jgi:Flp pilus assembly protein TadG
MIRNDRGMAAVWVAVIIVFLMGAAALAVDASGAFNTARTDQNTADLACLAGVKELPEDPNAAINVVVEYVEANWPAMTGQTLSVSGTTADYTDGQGNTVTIDVAYGGDPSKAHVAVTEVQETWFAKVLGQNSVTISQEAWCRVDERSIGGGGLPFGAAPGGFNGDLQKLNPCETGNCGPLFIDRDDTSGVGDTIIKNIALGPDRTLVPDLDTLDNPNCWDVSAGDDCSVVKTDTGVSASHLGEGLLQRLEHTANSTCIDTFNGRDYDCDTMTQILGTTPAALDPTGAPPSGWIEGLHGVYGTVDVSNHYYFNGEIAKCDSPRLGFMPIVSENLTWGYGDPVPPYPNGNKDVKIVGFYWVIITQPIDPSDWQGSGPLKSASANVMWFGPGTTCTDGFPIDPTDPTVTTKDVLLVNEIG